MWRQERLRDLSALRETSGFQEAFTALRKGGLQHEREALQNILGVIRHAYHYSGIIVLDRRGMPLLAVGESRSDTDYTAETQRLVNELRRGAAPGLSSMYVIGGSRLNIDLAVPIKDSAEDGAPVGFIVTRSDPGAAVFSSVSDLPRRLRSLETLVVDNRAGEGHWALHLTQQDRVAENRLITLNPSEKALLRGLPHQGESSSRVRRTDHHGNQVLGILQPVPGVDWSLLAKVDRSEVLQPLYRLAFWISSIVFVALAIISSLLVVLWRQQHRTHELSLLAASVEHEKSLSEQEAVYREMFQANPHPMWVYDLETLRFLAVNDAAVEHYGYSRAEFLEMTISDIRPPEDVPRLKRHVAGQPEEGIDRAGLWRHCKKNNELIHVEIASHRLVFDGRDADLVLAYDVTQSRWSQMELQRLNRFYAALSKMNAAIIRTRSADRILQEVCRIAAEYGELALVWVGQLQQDSKVVPVASYGVAQDYLKQIRVSADADRPEGRGPVGKAIRSGSSQVMNNFTEDDDAVNWHRAAKEWTLNSVLACPIQRNGEIWGVLAFCANQRDYFTRELTALLEELSADLAYSLEMIDIERERSEAQAQLLLNAKIVESTHEGLFITDSDRRITLVNPALCEMTGYHREELIGADPGLFKSGVQDAAFYEQMWQHLMFEGQWEGEIWNRRRDGAVFPAWLAITRVLDDTSNRYFYIAITRDITEQKDYENQIRHIASHDILTDLPNRVLLEDRISYAISQAQRGKHILALLFIDLDRFKLINDTLGHDIGDALIKEVSERIVGVLRRSDTVSRIGGDEFIALLTEINSAEDAAVVAEKINRRVAQPGRINGHELIVTASIGIAVYPENGRTVEELTHMADVAMMTAKQGGKDRYHFYSGEMAEEAGEYLDIQNELRFAVERRELFVTYQPQVAFQDGKILGLEALVRWQHPRYGLVSPSRFIPIAEDSGQIVEIGRWILHETCRQARDWRSRGVIDVPVSVNVSALQFRQFSFVDRVLEVLAETGLPPASLELEVTESLLMTTAEKALEKLSELNRHGVRLAIDDFGTGYSSLSYLRQIPAVRLKIDKSFIADLPHDGDAVAIARAIVSLGSALGLDIVAEGVETQEQAEFLSTIWCRQGQGFLYTPPLPADEFENWLEQWRNRPAAG